MKLSIITINRNNAEGLRKTMESVFSQTYREFEYIVVDGASTDSSVEVIRSYALQAEGLDFKWISEPDTGIYNAMNKGIEIAERRRAVNSFNRSELVEDKNGEADRQAGAVAENKATEDGYVLMLNSGDFLIDEHVIERIMPELHTEDMIQGNLIIDYPTKTVRYRGYGHSNISFLDVLKANFPHQAMFIKLSVMKKYGYYDENYKKASDSYFFITALGLGNATFRYINVDIANFDSYGISSKLDPQWQQIGTDEDAKWFAEHVPNRLMELSKEAPKKMQLYDTLSRHKWIWHIISVLAKISEKIRPTPPYVKIERVK